MRVSNDLYYNPYDNIEPVEQKFIDEPLNVKDANQEGGNGVTTTQPSVIIELSDEAKAQILSEGDIILRIEGEKDENGKEKSKPIEINVNIDMRIDQNIRVNTRLLGIPEGQEEATLREYYKSLEGKVTAKPAPDLPPDGKEKLYEYSKWEKENTQNSIELEAKGELKPTEVKFSIDFGFKNYLNSVLGVFRSMSSGFGSFFGGLAGGVTSWISSLFKRK